MYFYTLLLNLKAQNSLVPNPLMKCMEGVVQCLDLKSLDKHTNILNLHFFSPPKRFLCLKVMVCFNKNWKIIKEEVRMASCLDAKEYINVD